MLKISRLEFFTASLTPKIKTAMVETIVLIG